MAKPRPKKDVQRPSKRVLGVEVAEVAPGVWHWRLYGVQWWFSKDPAALDRVHGRQPFERHRLPVDSLETAVAYSLGYARDANAGELQGYTDGAGRT